MNLPSKVPTLVLVFFFWMLSNNAHAQNCDAICVDGETCIAAALYPYVPDTESFSSAICSAWTASGQSEKLYLIADENVWDGG